MTTTIIRINDCMVLYMYTRIIILLLKLCIPFTGRASHQRCEHVDSIPTQGLSSEILGLVYVQMLLLMRIWYKYMYILVLILTKNSQPSFSSLLYLETTGPRATRRQAWRERPPAWEHSVPFELWQNLEISPSLVAGCPLVTLPWRCSQGGCSGGISQWSGRSWEWPLECELHRGPCCGEGGTGWGAFLLKSAQEV